MMAVFLTTAALFGVGLLARGDHVIPPSKNEGWATMGRSRSKFPVCQNGVDANGEGYFRRGARRVQHTAGTH